MTADSEVQLPYVRVTAPGRDLAARRLFGIDLRQVFEMSHPDPNRFYGQVVYGPGLRLDAPVSVTRYSYTDTDGTGAHTTWPGTQTIVPFWNQQGMPSVGAFADGTVDKAYNGANDCAVGTGANRCYLVEWSAARSAYDQRYGHGERWFWHGSVLEGKRDVSDYDYRRNRFYNPRTGRFTQEDPIGLAGGLNLYGFAGSDPVNFSDPFGLDPCKTSSAWTECLAQALADWGARRGGALGDLALNTGAVLNAVLEGTGINAAASVGDAIGSGRLGEGGVALAMTFGPMRLGKGAVAALMRDASDNPGNWRTVGRFIEAAINKKAKGGISVQQVIENANGERLVRHTVLDKAGNVIDDHFRLMLKP